VSKFLVLDAVRIHSITLKGFLMDSATYIKALETEAKHVEQLIASAVDAELADLKARLKDIKAEINKSTKASAGKLEKAVVASGVETAVSQA